MSRENERRAMELSLSHQYPSHHDAAPLCELCGVLAGHSGICYGKLDRALDEAEARGRPQWRPASEPPDTSRDVLVVTPDDMGKPCQWVAHHEGGWCCVGEFDPTHWMELPPLPEPPTQTTEED